LEHFKRSFIRSTHMFKYTLNMTSYYTASLGLEPSTVSWIGSVQNFLTFFLGAGSGRLLDAGYFTPCFLVGSIIQVLGIFFMSLSTNYWQLMLSQGVMTGLGGGIMFTPAMGLMGSYFSTKRAFAIGVATTGNSVGVSFVKIEDSESPVLYRFIDLGSICC